MRPNINVDKFCFAISFLFIVSGTPLPILLVLNIYVADFSKGLLKKCVNACSNKCVKMVRKFLGKNANLPKYCVVTFSH